MEFLQGTQSFMAIVAFIVGLITLLLGAFYLGGSARADFDQHEIFFNRTRASVRRQGIGITLAAALMFAAGSVLLILA
ncbi:hypothetical protein [uncultured Arthrobacter sp.]|uniref:hypothetical protein n=1 Tax=uncultured Arthrobacter sp. TaxID=114050 RepID=UPI0026188468|nr:hypothetical protein [uncultured Arthrobacter sp.]